MENQTNQNNDSVFWDFVINAAVVIAAFALYAKTQEVFTALAPAQLFGQKGLALIYGFTVAGLVEGVTLALHFLHRFDGNKRAEGYKWFLFAVSTFCQFLDTALVKDTANQSTMEAFFAWIALGIVPAIFFGLLWVKGGVEQSVGKTRGQWIGLVPSVRNFLFGSVGKTPESEMQALATETEQAKLEEPDEPDESDEALAKTKKKSVGKKTPNPT